ncbi:MFS general substrate transporter [Melanomma pulvis-pyrius CBS 109.77]|uniref:MFS general substrate transporter n=1 Tax=Melanomma pulvis-pyrius CBS 109.77 TaxID=1314802 RepID=A0A6A6X054_9PLEO|nr:MFS general substrate transporter [Melanomma pulvis-pyrius CBS 109.77]
MAQSRDMSPTQTTSRNDDLPNKAVLSGSPDKFAPEGDAAYSIFSNGIRTYLTYLLGFVITISTLTATIFFPLIPMLSRHFSVSIQAINLTVTVYAISQAISPSIFASLADFYPVLLLLIGIYIIQSIGASATPTIAYGIVADVSVVSKRRKMLCPMLSACNGISAVGLVIGGAVALNTNGYTWVFLSLLIVAIIFFVMVGFTVPETARSVVGNGSIPVHGIWRTWMSFSHGRASVKASQSLRRVFDSLRITLNPDAAVILWMAASSYGIYYTFQVAIPVIFDDVYAYNELEIGLTFLPGLAGMTIGGVIAGKLIDKNYAKEARKQDIDISQPKETNLDEFPIERARYINIIPFIVFEMALVAG